MPHSGLSSETSPHSQGFTGFRPEALAFLAELGRLQDGGDYEQAREFFQANRHVHERELKEPLGALMDDLAARFKASGIPLTGGRSTSLFRINRDVRFSRDKSPYKTHSGAVLTPNGTRKEQGVLYMHVAPGECLMAAGFYRPDPAQLARLRGHIRDNPGKFREILRGLAANGLALDTEDTLKRPPRGFEDVSDPDLAAAVKLKGYTVLKGLGEYEIMDASLADRLEAFAGQAMPLLRFGWEALERGE